MQNVTKEFYSALLFFYMMPNKSVKDFMEADHDRLDSIYKEFKEKKHSEIEKAKELFGEFKKGLERHIVWEEEILFPVFEDKTGMKTQGPTVVMRMEHEQIKSCLERILERISGNDPDTDEIERELEMVLGAHNEKEESILYPWIDQTFSEQEVEAFFSEISK